MICGFMLGVLEVSPSDCRRRLPVTASQARCEGGRCSRSPIRGTWSCRVMSRGPCYERRRIFYGLLLATLYPSFDELDEVGVAVALHGLGAPNGLAFRLGCCVVSGGWYEVGVGESESACQAGEDARRRRAHTVCLELVELLPVTRDVGVVGPSDPELHARMASVSRG